jgi:hypothetical protein
VVEQSASKEKTIRAAYVWDEPYKAAILETDAGWDLTHACRLEDLLCGRAVLGREAVQREAFLDRDGAWDALLFRASGTLMPNRLISP